jgi:ribosome maturation factor RimP
MRVRETSPFLLAEIFMSLEQQLRDIIEPSIEHMGFSLVVVKMTDILGKRTLQIMAERIDGEQITVEDCAKISHTTSALLDVEDPISGAYHLEVGSPGIDRPLVKLADYNTYAGFEAKFETHIPVNGRKRYKGLLKGVEGEAVIIEIDTENFTVPFRDISHGKLVLTDSLIKAYQDKKINH